MSEQSSCISACASGRKDRLQGYQLEGSEGGRLFGLRVLFRPLCNTGFQIGWCLSVGREVSG